MQQMSLIAGEEEVQHGIVQAPGVIAGGGVEVVVVVVVVGVGVGAATSLAEQQWEE